LPLTKARESVVFFKSEAVKRNQYRQLHDSATTESVGRRVKSKEHENPILAG
jgi:hypothetical protein